MVESLKKILLANSFLWKLEVQNVQAYVLEVGRFLRLRGLHKFFSRKRWEKSSARATCMVHFAGFRYFLGKTTKWMAEKHRFGSGQWMQVWAPEPPKSTCSYLDVTDKIKESILLFFMGQSLYLLISFVLICVTSCVVSQIVSLRPLRKSRPPQSSQRRGDFPAWAVLGGCGRGCLLGQRKRGRKEEKL